MVYLNLGEETQPTLSKSDAMPRSGNRDLRRNKHQLLHRIAWLWTTLIYNNFNQFVKTEVCFIDKRVPRHHFEISFEQERIYLFNENFDQE